MSDDAMRNDTMWTCNTCNQSMQANHQTPEDWQWHEGAWWHLHNDLRMSASPVGVDRRTEGRDECAGTSDAPYVTVKLSVYRWHLLLCELEERMRIGNRQNPHIAVDLFENIASQLAEVDVKVTNPTKETEPKTV